MSYYHDPIENPFHTQGGADGFMYWGERAGWSIVDTLNYDPSPFDRANFQALADACGFELASPAWDDRPDLLGNDTDNCAIENYSGAAGKGQFLLVRPGSDAERIAYECHAKLADYPCLDEDLWSEFESDAEFESVVSALRYDYAPARFWSAALREWTAAEFLSQTNDSSQYVDRWPTFTDSDERQYLATAVREARKHVPRPHLVSIAE